MADKNMELLIESHNLLLEVWSINMQKVDGGNRHELNKLEAIQGRAGELTQKIQLEHIKDTHQ